MQLKKLSLCLFALSLTACSSHVIKSNNTTVNALDQRASNGINAMFDYPSYDYNGTFKFALDENSSKKTSTSISMQKNNISADPELEKQVQAVLKAQRIHLTTAQLQQLYQSIAAEDLRGLDSSSRSSKVESFLMNFLSELQFSYDGSIHYKQKLASMNLTARYERPTLLVQAKVPMIVDFDNYKFYTNYFALMPFMVNKDSQSTLAYIDFSKYKKDFEKFDIKAMASYLKESSALPYVLADGKNLERVSLNAQDKAQGAVEKIRLKISLEEWFLQARLYEQVNKPYFKEKMAGIFKDESTDTKVVDAAAAADSDESLASLSTYGMTETEAEAYKASQALYTLVNARFNLQDERSEDDECESAQDCAVAAASAATDAAAVACTNPEECDEAEAVDATAVKASDVAEIEEVEVDEGNLTSEQCEAIALQKKRPIVGDIQYCADQYEIDVLSNDSTDLVSSNQVEKTPSFLQTALSTEQTELDKRFEQYVSKDFKDAKAFKALWDQNQTEIQKELVRQGAGNPVIMDVALDDKGRAVRFDYDVQFKTKASGVLKFKTDMNILNYGNATAINRAELNKAKSIQEVSKDSPLEKMVGGFTQSLGVNLSSGDTASAEASKQSLDQQMKDLAVQIYDSTQSYAKTYQALFIMKMSAEQPKVVKLYTPTELNEIASAYAYAYADESIYNPQGKAKDEIDRLMKKHHLELNSQYDANVGESVYSIVEKTIEGQKDRQAWKTFVQKHKTAKNVFAEYYISEFLSDFEEDDLDTKQKANIRKTAQILAQAYEDTRNHKLSAKTIQNLKEDDVEFIDYDLYRKTFEKVSDSFK